MGGGALGPIAGEVDVSDDTSVAVSSRRALAHLHRLAADDGVKRGHGRQTGGGPCASLVGAGRGRNFHCRQPDFASVLQEEAAPVDNSCDLAGAGQLVAAGRWRRRRGNLRVRVERGRDQQNADHYRTPATHENTERREWGGTWASAASCGELRHALGYKFSSMLPRVGDHGLFSFGANYRHAFVKKRD